VKILLDTATFLWVVLSPSRLSYAAVHLYEDPVNDVYLSAASAYEIIVKVMLGKLDVGGSPSEFTRPNTSRAVSCLLQSTKMRHMRWNAYLRFTPIHSIGF
jgi:PIN domain nuclease of toxin-antitoxin system